MSRGIKKYNNYKRKREKYPRNERIRAEKVRVIDSEGENIGVMDTKKAIDIAYDKGLDLVLLSPNQKIPVAKIIDWSKFKYEQSKKKNSGHQVKNKEWWFKPKIHDHDIQVKLNQVKTFIDKGNVAKITIKYIRRSSFQELQETMETVMEMSKDFAEKASEIQKEGRNLSVLLRKKA